MKTLITSILILLFHFLANAQQTTVSGKVQDNITKEALPYVTIAVKDSALKTVLIGVTDEHGVFSLEKLPIGKMTISFSFMGYQNYSQPLEIISGKAKIELGTIGLVTDAVQLNAVEINGQKPNISLKLDKKVFEVGKDVLSQNGSANDVLNGVPSVAVSPTGGVSLRGNSSVLVLINGRQSGLTQTNALDQIAADQIDRIEVITNPSSRYDASGSAGIINIILKKNKKSGFNGQVRLVAGSPNDSRLNPSINYKSDKINIFSNFSIRSSDYVGLYTTNQSTINNGTPSLMNRVQNEDRHDDGKLMYLGADYFFDDHHTITAAFLKNATHDNDKTHLKYDYSNDTSLDSTLIREGKSLEKRDYNQLEFNYTQTFKQEAKKWTINVQYDWWNSDKNWNLSTERLFPTPVTYPGIRTKSIGNSKDLLIQSDFIQPIDSVSVFEFGIKSEIRKVSSDFLAEQQQENDWTIYQNIDNNLKYTETISSAYAQFSNKAGQFNYMLGFRTELTQISITDIKNTYDDKKNYGKLFPTVNMSYKFETSTLQLNYSKRINRPALYALYPFNELTDLNAQYIGNPDLNPSYTDAFELGFLKTWKKITLNPSFYYQREKNYIQDFTYRENDIFYTTPINIDYETRTGFELSTLYNPLKWLQINLEMNFYSFVQKGNYQEKNLDYNGETFTGRLSTQLKLPAKFSFQGRYNFRGEQQNAQTTNAALQSIDFGLSKTLLKDKATIVFDVSNAFNLRQNKNTTTGIDYLFKEVSIPNAARYRLSFVYRFNLTDPKVIRQANSANRN
ncbi:TonB-dependent receptor domain-containing protein [Flavobacterium pectinovorum]|uniref:Outer membrane receptor proteins, mostly Fe transport n=1 Tax=Flavobacterium pectinovorum TaxID=29533 RepID=A0AB36NXL6_9FLAO|nr:TonB-dependent receptor [Flavobacterium pectinovorum]OXB02376.1 TonB-dependent receptor [Flavobacterium pectinovorum]SHM36789.1 Outer membrane receptor proteins, mostly Fe transport [Flavobacterium pectinovorum]